MVIASVLALASLAAGAAGAATLSDPPSSVDQYVEVVPTGDGNANPRDKATPLSRSSARALATADQPTTAALKMLATSSVFGAPDQKLTPQAGAQASPELPNASFAGSLKETVGSLLSGGGRPLVLLIALTFITVAAAVLARNKNRSAG